MTIYPYVLYTGQAFQLVETPVFADWLGSLRDRRAMAKIVDRLQRASNGNFVHRKSVKGGVFEMRIDYGRVIVSIISSGASRSSSSCAEMTSARRTPITQNADVAEAKRLKEEIERQDEATPV